MERIKERKSQEFRVNRKIFGKRRLKDVNSVEKKKKRKKKGKEKYLHPIKD